MVYFANKIEVRPEQDKATHNGVHTNNETSMRNKSKIRDGAGGGQSCRRQQSVSRFPFDLVLSKGITRFQGGLYAVNSSSVGDGSLHLVEPNKVLCSCK